MMRQIDLDYLELRFAHCLAKRHCFDYTYKAKGVDQWQMGNGNTIYKSRVLTTQFACVLWRYDFLGYDIRFDVGFELFGYNQFMENSERVEKEWFGNLDLPSLGSELLTDFLEKSFGISVNTNSLRRQHHAHHIKDNDLFLFDFEFTLPKNGIIKYHHVNLAEEMLMKLGVSDLDAFFA